MSRLPRRRLTWCKDNAHRFSPAPPSESVSAQASTVCGILPSREIAPVSPALHCGDAASFDSFSLAFSPVEQLRRHWVWLLIPAGMLVFSLLVVVLSSQLSTPRWVRSLAVVAEWLFSLTSLAANCAFLASFYPFEQGMAFTGVGLLSFSLLSHAGYSVYLVRTCSQAGKAARTLACLLSVVDLSPLHLLEAGDRFRDEVRSFRAANVFFRLLPLLVLQALSLPTVVPTLTLVAMFINACLLLTWVVEEVSFLVRLARAREGSKARGPDPSALKVPLLGTDQPETPASRSPLDRVFLWVSLPLVTLSFLPQMMTLVGLPFVIGCLRRFITAGEATHSPLERRGLFLVSLNMVSFFLVMGVVLPGVSAVGMLLNVYNSLQHRFTGVKSTTFGSFRHSLQTQFSLLSFCFLPLLDRPPVVRLERHSSLGDFSWWKTAFVILWLLAVEVALPVSDIVTDFVFSFQLLGLSRDPVLTDRDELAAWAIVSFASTALGLLAALPKLLLILLPVIRSPSFGRLREVSIAHSVFAPPLLDQLEDLGALPPAAPRR